MNPMPVLSRITNWILFSLTLSVFVECYGQSVGTTEASYDGTGIDYETLSLFGVSREFADQFRVNLVKAIALAKTEDSLRQEYGGVSGGFYQAGGGAGGGGGGGGGGGAEDEEGDEDGESTGPVNMGPSPFGVLSGIFGLLSGLGTLNPTRIAQSTVNFFPPAQRAQAQAIVDSLLGYTPPENRTSRPRPRTPPTTPMTITEQMMKEVTTEPSKMSGNKTAIDSKDNEGDKKMPSNSTSVDNADLVEIVEATTVPATTEGFINVHELLNRTTTPPPPRDEDDEVDSDKHFYSGEKVKPNASNTGYKLLMKPTPEVKQVEMRGVDEAEEATSILTLNETTISASTIATIYDETTSNVTIDA